MEKTNSEILELWRNNKNQKRTPLLYPNLKENSLLFIGLNPSFSEQGYKTILKDEPGFSEILANLESYFLYENFNDSKISIITKIGQISKEKYAYFKKFKDIASKTKLDWEHIDLLFVRETEQKEIQSQIESTFFQEQIKISINLIEILKPRLIVIENAFASKLLKDRLKLNWNDQIGTYLYNETTPVFLSGMLTGQRALDIGSYDRLIWHIKFVNEMLKNKL